MQQAQVDYINEPRQGRRADRRGGPGVQGLLGLQRRAGQVLGEDAARPRSRRQRARRHARQLRRGPADGLHRARRCRCSRPRTRRPTSSGRTSSPTSSSTRRSASSRPRGVPPDPVTAPSAGRRRRGRRRGRGGRRATTGWSARPTWPGPGCARRWWRPVRRSAAAPPRSRRSAPGSTSATATTSPSAPCRSSRSSTSPRHGLRYLDLEPMQVCLSWSADRPAVLFHDVGADPRRAGGHAPRPGRGLPRLPAGGPARWPASCWTSPPASPPRAGRSGGRPAAACGASARWPAGRGGRWPRCCAATSPARRCSARLSPPGRRCGVCRRTCRAPVWARCASRSPIWCRRAGRSAGPAPSPTALRASLEAAGGTVALRRARCERLLVEGEPRAGRAPGRR